MWSKAGARGRRGLRGSYDHATPDWPDILASLKTGVSRRRYPGGDIVYRQGDPAEALFFIETGSVRLSVVSHQGREGIIAMLGPGDFFGEAALAGLCRQPASAVVMDEACVIRVEKAAMRRALSEHGTISGEFLNLMLARHIQIQADLADHLFNSSERRLARLLLLMAGGGRRGHGDTAAAETVIPRVTQEVLAARVGTTRARVSHFMNKFRRLGMIEAHRQGLKIDSARLTAVMHEEPGPAAGRPGSRLLRTPRLLSS